MAVSLFAIITLNVVCRVGKTTLYGAISNSLTRPVFRVGASTNKETTIAFLQDVAAHLTKRCRPWLILDGHGAHKAAMSEPIGASFRPLPMPKSSCEFNSIETVWRYGQMLSFHLLH